MQIILQDPAGDCRGEFCIKVYKKGKLQEEYADHNLVVRGGRKRLAELAAGLSGAHISYIGVGSGTVKEAEDDTALTEQHLFPLTGATVTGLDARFDFVVLETQANGLSIREFGLFCTDKTMFTHRVRIFADSETGEERVLTIDKGNDIEIRGYWILHF